MLIRIYFYDHNIPYSIVKFSWRPECYQRAICGYKTYTNISVSKRLSVLNKTLDYIIFSSINKYVTSNSDEIITKLKYNFSVQFIFTMYFKSQLQWFEIVYENLKY